MAIAIDCFARFGYQGTSIDRIARAAGVTKGALYYHFRDKEELLFEAVKDRVGGFERRVVERVEPLESPAAALREIACVCPRARSDNHRRFIITLMVEALDTNPRCRREFREHAAAHSQLPRAVDPARAGARRVSRRRRRRRPPPQSFAGGIMGAEIQHYQDPEQDRPARGLRHVRRAAPSPGSQPRRPRRRDRQEGEHGELQADRGAGAHPRDGGGASRAR